MLKKINDFSFMLEKRGGMNVPGIIYADEQILAAAGSAAVKQVENAACLPGIVTASFAMPDIHAGYGFPIGGVAAFDTDIGVVSPGGVGYDINCGVRLIRTNIEAADIKKRAAELCDMLYNAVPSGTGSSGPLSLSGKELKAVLKKGAAWAVENGYGSSSDTALTEDNGRMETDADSVSKKAIERGRNQLGTLGSGNHFIELQEVDEIFDAKAADAFHIYKGMAVIMLHTGSRGLGHQVCDDCLLYTSDACRRRG